MVEFCFKLVFDSITSYSMERVHVFDILNKTNLYLIFKKNNKGTIFQIINDNRHL